MTASLSEVSICNQAISWLGGTLITSLDDESTEAELCKANYDILRDMLLEGHDWTFAKSRYYLTPTVETPAFGYSAQFLIPANVLRIIQPIGTGTTSNLTEYEIEGEYILANADALYVRAISSIINPQQFSLLFAEALAARLASEIARPLTHSASLAKEMWSLFSIKLSEAVASDGMQEPPIQTGMGRLVGIRNFGGIFPYDED